MPLTWKDVRQMLGIPFSREEEVVLQPPPLAEGEIGCYFLPSRPAAPEKDYGSLSFPHVSTDTRTLQAGDIFVALHNEKVDGHDFVPLALEKGAGGLVVERNVDADVPVFVVADTQVAYGQLARLWRDKFTLPVVGITGSVGKTTAKEMLALALSPLGSILKTPASQNNETGVPKTLLQLTNEHAAAVIEMGMRGTGQIAYLCEIARPTIGVVTLIGDNHLELLGTRDAIADAKGELLEALPSDGAAILNADDPYFACLAKKTSARVVSYGVKNGAADFLATDIVQSDGGWQFNVKGIDVRLSSPAKHDILNALSALAAAEACGVPVRRAARALESYAPLPLRMEKSVFANGVVLLNDSYNAAPDSMKSALETLIGLPATRRVAFLGDMRELGTASVDAHSVIHQWTAQLDELYTVGALAEHIPGAIKRFNNSDEAAQFALTELHLGVGDAVLVKGSRAMQMERVAFTLAEKNAVGLPPPKLGGPGGPDDA